MIFVFTPSPPSKTHTKRKMKFSKWLKSWPPAAKLAALVATLKAAKNLAALKIIE